MRHIDSNRIAQSTLLLVLGLILWIYTEPDLFCLNRGFFGGPTKVGFGIAVAILLCSSVALHTDRHVFSLRLRWSDIKCIALSICILLPTLTTLGLQTGFIQFTSPSIAQWNRLPYIFFLNALPEEILFRSIFQDTLVKFLGKRTGLVLATLIFGWSHINNSTKYHTPPNWPYVGLATIAGFFYGLTYLRTGLVLTSTLLHFLVNTIWLFFFSKL